MKVLLVGEYRDGKLLAGTYELAAFARALKADATFFLVGSENQLPKVEGRVYLAEALKYGDFNPDLHKQLLLQVIEAEKPEVVAFLHSSYGWDLAPRIAFSLNAAQVSEVVEIADGAFVVPSCNSKLRRILRPSTSVTVVTIQAGAFTAADNSTGTPVVERVDVDAAPGGVEFIGYESGEKGGVDLTRAEVIVSAGRGVGKKENIEIIGRLAKALGGELSASRPVVDAGWVDHSRQVGTTGQTVAPKLYIACGISGAIQHLAGMKKSGFVVAINKDRDAPIGEIADVLIVADVLQFCPVLAAKIEQVSSGNG